MKQVLRIEIEAGRDHCVTDGVACRFLVDGQCVLFGDLEDEDGRPVRAEECTGRARRGAKAVELGTWLAGLGPDEPAIPEDDPVFAWAKRAGVPAEFLLLAWRRFKEDMTARRVRKRDWRAHFRNACRGNWYRLWYVDRQTGEVALSSIGMMEKRHGRD